MVGVTIKTGNRCSDRSVSFSESAVSFDAPRKPTMKLFLVLIVTACASAVTEDEEFLQAAAFQLQRLAPYQRVVVSNEQNYANSEDRDLLTNEYFVKLTKKKSEPQEKEAIPMNIVELLRIFRETIPKHPDRILNYETDVVNLPNPSANERRDQEFIKNEELQAIMQERVKRSEGSGGFLSGIASKVVGSVVGASTGASRGSSSGSDHGYGYSYGPPSYSYGAKPFNIWDFKKAIFNTIFQAIKAVSGGGIALTGHLIKGTGFLVSTKGRLISSAGDAVKGLGKALASSAIIASPKPVYGSPGYSYQAPQANLAFQTIPFDGLPPSTDEHFATNFGESTDHKVEPGLLVAKPEIPEETDKPPTEYPAVDSEPQSPSHLDNQNLFGAIAGTSTLVDPRVPGSEKPDIPHHENQLELQNPNEENYELYPPLGNSPTNYDSDKSPQTLLKPSHSFAHQQQPNYFYTPQYLESQGTGSDIQLDLSLDTSQGHHPYDYTVHTKFPGFKMHEPLKIPILRPDYTGLKSTSFPGYEHLAYGAGKELFFDPASFELQKSLSFELDQSNLRRRRRLSRYWGR